MPRYQPHRLAVGTKISAELGLLAGRLTTTASGTYARLGIGSLEAKVLLIVGEQGTSIINSRVAEVLGVDRSAISRTVKALIRDGALRAPNSGERLLSLTPRGEALCSQIRVIEEERNRRLLEGLSEADQTFLADYLERLWANTPELVALASRKAAERREASRRELDSLEG